MRVAYVGEYHPTSGTYYRQRITLTKDEYERINQELKTSYDECYTNYKKDGLIDYNGASKLVYGCPIHLNNENKCYLHLTQLFEIASIIYKWSGYEKQHKRITNNNTVLMVK